MAATTRQSWNLRVNADDQQLIDRAVSASGLTRTDFVLQAARAAVPPARLRCVMAMVR